MDGTGRGGMGNGTCSQALLSCCSGTSAIPDDFKSETTVVIDGQTYNAKASDFQFDSFILGRGRYGTVYRAKHIPSNMTMAIKVSLDRNQI